MTPSIEIKCPFCGTAIEMRTGETRLCLKVGCGATIEVDYHKGSYELFKITFDKTIVEIPNSTYKGYYSIKARKDEEAN